jgi:hypothetical protein
MALPLVLGAAKGAAGLWKGADVLTKLMALMFGYDIVKGGLGAATGLTEHGTEKAQVKLAGRQAELAAAMGKREEERTDKLIRQLMGEKQKEYIRSEKAAANRDIRASSERQNEMAMAMLMALSGFQQQQSEIASRPAPSTASMLSLMR